MKNIVKTNQQTHISGLVTMFCRASSMLVKSNFPESRESTPGGVVASRVINVLNLSMLSTYCWYSGCMGTLVFQMSASCAHENTFALRCFIHQSLQPFHIVDKRFLIHKEILDICSKADKPHIHKHSYSHIIL